MDIVLHCQVTRRVVTMPPTWEAQARTFIAAHRQNMRIFRGAASLLLVPYGNSETKHKAATTAVMNGWPCLREIVWPLSFGFTLLSRGDSGYPLHIGQPTDPSCAQFQAPIGPSVAGLLFPFFLISWPFRRPCAFLSISFAWFSHSYSAPKLLPFVRGQLYWYCIAMRRMPRGPLPYWE